jgi:DMSO/TMAO reductase YedYZ molybdopterin-dependent catalytic subunit
MQGETAASPEPDMNLSPLHWLRRTGKLFGLLALLAAANIAAQTEAPSAAKLTVGGNVANPSTLSLDDLKRLPVQDLDDVRQMRAGGAAVAGSEQVRHYKGVLLRDVLAAAKPVEKEHRELRQSIVVATATDGYKAVFSWAELFLSPIGDGALVIFERDGGPLAPSEGPLALVSLRDTQPGPRHVKWLVKIDLLRVRE